MQASLPKFCSPALVISVSVIAAALLLQDSVMAHLVALAVVLTLVAVTIAEPWLGILALFPLAIPIAAPSTVPGVQEAAFATLAVAVLARSLIGAFLHGGAMNFFRVFGIPLVIALAIFVANLLAAIRVGTPLHDWMRGAAPYVFLLMAIPIAVELNGRLERIHWLGLAIGSAAILHCVHVLGYFVQHKMWEYQWFVEKGGVLTRVTEAIAKANPLHGSGPYVYRITVAIASSTDAIIPLGLTLGFVAAVIAPARRERLFGLALAALSLAAILVTYTRSMLLSSLLVISMFCIYLACCQRLRLKFAMLLLSGLIVYGSAVIFVFGLQLTWLNRATTLADSTRQSVASLQTTTAERLSGSVADTKATDSSVTTRIDEYRIAWSMFLDHPIIGNGLGTRHAIGFSTSEGHIIHQSVGYIHNWVLYMLMAGGVVGFVAYAVLLLWPMFLRVQANSKMNFEIVMLRVIPATLAIYGLFFAVARLITFNLLIAAIWGSLLALGGSVALLNPACRKPSEPAR